MGAIFKIEFKLETDEGRQKFASAFKDIYLLSKMLTISSHEVVKTFLQDRVDKDSHWLTIEEDNCIVIVAERYVTIDPNAAKAKTIIYDFGKEFPAPSSYLGAIMSIISYYFPAAQIARDAEAYYEEFNKGVLLARIVNHGLRNPFCKTPNNLIRNDKEISKIRAALSNEFAIDALKKQSLAQLVDSEKLVVEYEEATTEHVLSALRNSY